MSERRLRPWLLAQLCSVCLSVRPQRVRMSERRLRPWLLAQLSSGRFPGLQWDDPERRALRIPWSRAGRGGAGGGAGAALCRAWAEFKGRVRPGAPPDPSGWKCRLRCALHRSPDFQHIRGRGLSDGPRPYRVYRLLPRPITDKGAGTTGDEEEEEGGAEEEPGEEAPPPSAEQEAEPEPIDSGLAPPPQPLRIVIDSAEPLPPPEAVGQHRAGRGPRPQHHVTLAVGQELGPHDGPHNRPLVLQLEQAFARELLDGAAPSPIAAP